MLVYNNLSIIISAAKWYVKAKTLEILQFMRVNCICLHIKLYMILIL